MRGGNPWIFRVQKESTLFSIQEAGLKSGEDGLVVKVPVTKLVTLHSISAMYLVGDLTLPG